MQSVAQDHFPQYVFRDGTKLLWNPILKKSFVDRPEERVRLQIVDYLILEAGFSASRISFESPVNLPRDKSASRTDIICFDKDFNPFLLVECKAPEIALNEKASVQIARYNQKVEAPFLLITNGLEDLWFDTRSDSVSSLLHIPEKFKAQSILKRDFEYWNKRGFAGNKTHPEARKWVLESCEFLYGAERNSLPKYFKFEGASKELLLPNYYSIFNVEKNIKLAVALTGTPFGSTRLNCVLNKNGENTALLSSSLDLLANGDSKNTTIQSRAGTFNVDLYKEIAFDFEQPVSSLIGQLSDFLTKS
ncbi:MAG: type I restriction enzyme HsdR N-terminal domain-containing protein [Balneola sp.]